MAQIEPKTILQTYLEHQGSNQPEKGHQKCQKQSRLPATPTNLSTSSLKKTCRTGWADCPSDRPVDKNCQILIQCSLKNKESKKKNGAQFRARMREKWLKQTNVFRHGLQLNWDCGNLNLYPIEWYEPRNRPWRHFIMDQMLALNRIIGELTWGPKID